MPKYAITFTHKTLLKPADGIPAAIIRVEQNESKTAIIDCLDAGQATLILQEQYGESVQIQRIQQRIDG